MKYSTEKSQSARVTVAVAAALAGMSVIGPMAAQAAPEQPEQAFPDQKGYLETGWVDTGSGKQLLTYEVIDGFAVFEGDIMLGPVDQLRANAPSSKAAIGTKPSRRWPGGVVPYTINSDVPDTSRITSAISWWESATPVRFELRTTETDYLTFKRPTSPGSCSSSVGNQRSGQQFINLGDYCSTGNAAHEIGHTLGLWHEQSRTDRDNHIEIHWDEVEPGKESQFMTYVDRGYDGANLMAYSVESVMHYGSYSFYIGSDPTITLLDGTTFSANRSYLPTSDACAVRRWMGFGAGADFNGDGHGDYIMGVPYENLSGTDEGVLSVWYGGPSGFGTAGSEYIHRDSSGVDGSAANGDRFGRSLVVGDFNADCYDDVAVGVPLDNFSGISNAGSVQIFYGSSTGLAPHVDEIFTENTAGMPGAGAETGDNFGSVLETGDFNGDGISDLAIGTPKEDIGSLTDTGSVTVLYGSTAGLTTTGAELWNKNTGLQGNQSTGDKFGSSLAAGDFDRDGFEDLAIGIPYDDVEYDSSIVEDAGSVAIIYGSIDGLVSTGNQNWDQAPGDFPGAPETSDRLGYSLASGDFDGDGYRDLAIGVPFESIGSVSKAGYVVVLEGGATGLTTSGVSGWHQDTASVKGSAESNDKFAFSLVAGDTDRDGFDELIVGVPYEDIKGVTNTGMIHVIPGSGSGLTAADDKTWSQRMSCVIGSAEEGDRFGYTLSLSDVNGDSYPDLFVGVPYEDIGTVVDAGAVNVLPGSASGLRCSPDEWVDQSLRGIVEPSDHFGLVLP